MHTKATRTLVYISSSITTYKDGSFACYLLLQPFTFKMLLLLQTVSLLPSNYYYSSLQ